MHIDTIEHIDDRTGRVLVRNGVTVAFFLDVLLYERCEEIIEVFDMYASALPADALKWAVPSATAGEWREVDNKMLQRMRMSLRPPGAVKRKLTGFRVNDSAGSAPQYSFRVLDGKRNEAFPDARTCVQLTFPTSFLEEERVASLVALVDQATQLLQPVYGYCAPGLLTSVTQQGEAFASLRGIAMRYPGYDAEMNDRTRLHIGDHARGARWISLLGEHLTRRVGGVNAVRAALPPEVDVRQLGSVVLIQAGRFPELGDTNRRQDPVLLRAVARLLEPVTLFSEPHMLTYFANGDEDFLRRWERRFLD